MFSLFFLVLVGTKTTLANRILVGVNSLPFIDSPVGGLLHALA